MILALAALQTPAIPTLDKPFTLVYRMTYRNVETKAMREVDVAARIKELAPRVDADQMTQAAMDREIADLRRDYPPAVRFVTLSYDGRTLLVDERSSLDAKTYDSVLLFDGRFTYHFFASIGRRTGLRGAGTAQYSTSNVPYVGASLPFFTLAKEGKVWDPFAWDRKPVHVRGKIERDRQGIVRRITLGQPDPPYRPDEFVLSDPMAFQGASVARKIVATLRDYFHPNTVAWGQPRARVEHGLVSSRPAPLDAKRFDPDGYLIDGDDFNLDGVTTAFRVDHAKGALPQQIEATLGGGR